MQRRQFRRYVVIRTSLAFRGAEEQNIDSHRNSEKNSAQQQPLCPCHGSPSSFVLQRDSASLMPLVNRRRLQRKGRRVKGIRPRPPLDPARFRHSVAFCYRVKRQTVAGHPRSKCKDPIRHGIWSEKIDKVFVSTELLVISLYPRLMAPALLGLESGLIIWEVTWLNRSSRRSLCR